MADGTESGNPKPRKPYTWTPEGLARRRETLARVNSPMSPERRAAALVNLRKGSGWNRLPLTDEQRKIYEKARRAGVPRDVALASVMGGAPGSGGR